MVDKLNKRQEQRAKPDASVGSDIHNPDGAAEISDSQMFMNMGNRVVWTREE